MEVGKFVDIIGADFYTGVPDSQLKALCNFLISQYGLDGTHHIIGANEGNCVGIAAGYYLSTGKTPVVYLQNSGEGNIINPVASLLNDMVYGIPAIFVIGWRGEPGVHDEPQHAYQGRITLDLLEDMNISYMILDKETTSDALEEKMYCFSELLSKGQQVAFVVKKGALSYNEKISYGNEFILRREEVINAILDFSEDDCIVSTTGKTSRELFELREKNKQKHDLDFLTVGSMGHSSSIALGIALQKPQKRVWVLDGDGAALMHMGSMVTMAKYAGDNVVHVVINNGAHESVGGQPTAMSEANLVEIAKGCGYSHVTSVSTISELRCELAAVKQTRRLTFIEVKCGIGSREDLGRPTISPRQNMEGFIERLGQ